MQLLEPLVNIVLAEVAMAYDERRLGKVQRQHFSPDTAGDLSKDGDLWIALVDALMVFVRDV